MITFFTRHGHTVIPSAEAVIKNRRGVFALAIKGGLGLLVNQVGSHDTLELPGGGIEDGEGVTEAMRREWLEETGLSFDLQGPVRTYQQVRGHYAEDKNEFWIYDQTFHLYDYTGDAKDGHFWHNPEGDPTGWSPIAAWREPMINRAHWLGIGQLLGDRMDSLTRIA